MQKTNLSHKMSKSDLYRHERPWSREPTNSDLHTSKPYKSVVVSFRINICILLP